MRNIVILRLLNAVLYKVCHCRMISRDIKRKLLCMLRGET